jgi:hypothetical protein
MLVELKRVWLGLTSDTEIEIDLTGNISADTERPVNPGETFSAQ